MTIILNRNVILAAMALALVGTVSARKSQEQTLRYPQFENDDLRVWKSVIAPKAPLTMHRHDHLRVIVALAGGTMNLVEQNGPTEQHVWETKAYWLPTNPPNTLHADVNGGRQAHRSDRG